MEFHLPWAHLDTTSNIRGSAKRNAAFTLQHGAMLTPQQPEGCVPVVVSKSDPLPFGFRHSFGICYWELVILYRLPLDH